MVWPLRSRDVVRGGVVCGGDGDLVAELGRLRLAIDGWHRFHMTFTLFLSRPSPSFVIIVLLFFPGSPSFHLPLIHDPISVSSFIDLPPTTNRRHYPGALVSALSLHSHSHSRLHFHLGTLLDLHSHSQGSPLNKLDPNSLHPEQLHSCISTL